MAEQKDDSVQTAKPLQSKQAPPADPVSVVRRKQRYLVGLRPTPGVSFTTHGDAFLERLPQMEGVDVIRTLQPRSSAASRAGHLDAAPDIVVVSMDEQRGEALRQHAPPHIIVEVDAPIGHSDLAPAEPVGWQFRARGMPYPKLRREVRFCVQGDGDRPLANATINLFGPGFPTQAITDASGLAALSTFTADPAEIHAVYVRPVAGHWERYIPDPSLDFARVNLVRLLPFHKSASKSVVDRQHGWGQRLMKFDRMSADWSGVGIKIGIIDSGCDVTHPILQHIERGIDLTRNHDRQTWRSDEIGLGTHCTGIIAGAATPTAEAVGCAPGAEIVILKVLPGGYCSDLIDALDACIEQRLDIVQIGVCCSQFSELVTHKLAAARGNGIACILGSGNSGNAVQFPANVPGTLAVAALGQFGEFPPDTRHAQRALPQWPVSGGIFPTYFSCGGPQVAACAPGVAIISSVPGGGYAAWDGTSMAAAHVTGLAALLLSHHPALQRNDYVGRPESRVAALQELIRAMAVPLAPLEPYRVGAGLPDLERVPSLMPLRMSALAGYARLRGDPFAAAPLSAAAGWG